MLNDIRRLGDSLCSLALAVGFYALRVGASTCPTLPRCLSRPGSCRSGCNRRRETDRGRSIAEATGGSETRHHPLSPPMDLRLGDTFTDDAGTWEVVVRPTTQRGGKEVLVKVRRPPRWRSAGAS